MLKKITEVLLVLAFGSSLLAGTLLNGKVAINLLKKGTLKENLPTQFCFHDEFVTLNGGYSKIIGRRFLNSVYRLPCGILACQGRRISQKRNADIIKSTVDMASGMGIKTVYLQLPYKLSMDGKMVPNGWFSDNPNGSANELLQLLSKMGIDYIDMRPIVANTESDVLRNFFVTDHHWNFLGAFTAFKVLTPELAVRLGMDGVLDDNVILNINSWKANLLPRQRGRFLGAIGRRVGPLFNGWDENVSYLTPTFDTEIERETQLRNGRIEHLSGSFDKAIIFQNVMGNPDSWFKDGGYSIYLGWDQPIVRLVNKRAVCGKKLMIVKDSYSLPLMAYLSTVFAEIVGIDFRHQKTKTLGQCVEQYQPDLLIIAMSANSLSAQEGALNF